ncbi:plexin-A2-like [Planococcus citri]|uniref:plexin-A2-like n=1 Tax=Planococcus citri TaxID=170843 RepID=UPI0031F9136E
MQFFCKTTTSCFIFVMYLILERIESLPDDGQGMSSSNNGNCSANTFCVPCMKSNLGCKWCVKTRTCYINGCLNGPVVKGGEDISILKCRSYETCDKFNTFHECLESSQFNDCGWCISKNNCTYKTDCSSSGDSPWIINNDIVKNLLFETVNATHLKYGESENILLHSTTKYSKQSLIQAAFKCQLTSENSKLNFPMDATIVQKQNDAMVSCLLPKSNDILLLPPENYTATANISLYTKANQASPIWSTNVTFSDCRAYSAKRKCMQGSQCHWCKDEEKCIYRSGRKTVCPNSPSSWIDSFWPEKGPLRGVTNITIQGENFEIKFENYQKAINVAGVPCKSIKYEDISSKKIECTIEPSSFQVSEGKIQVHVDDKDTSIWSDKNFMFVEPNITDMDPKEGFIYGGTELTIKGEHLDAGSSIIVSIGSQLCTIFFYNSSIIQCISSKSNTIAEDTVSVVFDKYAPNFTNNSYKYIKDEEHDENGFNVQPKGIPQGGIQILLRNVTSEQSNEFTFNVKYQSNIHNGSCKSQDDSTVMCSSPLMPINSNSINVANPMKFDFWLTDPSAPERNISISENQSSTFLLYPNPRFDHFFISSVPLNKKEYVIIEGKNINKACQKLDLIATMGNATCEVISLSSSRVICILPKSNLSDCTEKKCDVIGGNENIMIKIGNNFTASVPKQNSSSEENIKNPTSWDKIIYAAIGTTVIGTIFLILIIVCLCVNRKKSNTKMKQNLMKKQQQVDQLELRVAAECKEAFAELQTLTTALTSDLTYDSALFLDYRSYVMKILFSTISSYPVILGENPILINKAKGLKLFEELVMDRRFLLMFVKTLESQNSFSMNDRVYVASMLMMTLQKDMQFATNILKTLMSELIDSYIRDNKQPKLLFRSTENVVEKMISAWLSFLLHRFLKKSAGKPLLSLFNAIDQQVKNGPVDMITSEARYGLSENKIMRQKIDFTSLTVLVNVSKSTASIINLPKAVEKLPVKVLDCDTITQVKEKIIGAIFYSVRYSKRPNLQEISIEWIAGPTKWIYLSDQDSSSKIEGEWRQLNTLKHYGVFDKSILYLTSIHQEKDNVIQTTTSDSNSKNSYKRERYTPLSQFDTIKRKSAVIDSVSASIKNHNGGCREWHLVKPRDRKDSVDNDRDNHVIPEIYFTRLLAMKGGLQKYVDDLFETIFSKTHQHDCFPLAVKCMFDFLDGQALQHGITDPEVVHVWKNNCLPLRFWVNLIKNPEFLFDVHKSSVVDSCLSVIAQILMDSCSTTEQCLNKNSSTSKLLYAKEIPVYKKLVGKYYADIRNMSATSQREMNIMLAEESRIHAADFDKNSPLYELCKYALKYRTELTVALDGDATSQSYSLPFKFHRLINIMSAEPDLGFLRPIRRESFSSS